MGTETPHDLIAAYALDALEPGEAREFERHLASCEQCQSELEGMQEAAGALAFGLASPPPPPALRERILTGARGEPSNVVPLRANRPFRWAAGAAAAAAAAAVALAFWGTSLDGALDRERERSSELASVLADPAARRFPLGTAGTLVVARSGNGALVLRGLPEAPAGRRYMAWVIEDGRPEAAGLVEDVDGEHLLDRPVRPGSTVALTVEKGEVEAPTSAPVTQATVS